MKIMISIETTDGELMADAIARAREMLTGKFSGPMTTVSLPAPQIDGDPAALRFEAVAAGAAVAKATAAARATVASPEAAASGLAVAAAREMAAAASEARGDAHDQGAAGPGEGMSEERYQTYVRIPSVKKMLQQMIADGHDTQVKLVEACRRVKLGGASAVLNMIPDDEMADRIKSIALGQLNVEK